MKGKVTESHKSALLLKEKLNILCIHVYIVGRDSVVGIATHYELDSPEIESQWGQDFQHMSRPALGPTQPPVQWVLDHSQG
jgi:hypothetical protein